MTTKGRGVVIEFQDHRKKVRLAAVIRIVQDFENGRVTMVPAQGRARTYREHGISGWSVDAERRTT